MTLFAIFDAQAGKTLAPAAIPEKFSWFAALLPPAFALVHGLWLELIGFVVALVALSFAAPWLGADAAIWLYIVFAIAIGFSAPGLRRHSLAWRGWRHRGDRVAGDADLARLGALESRS
ncbi:hypothetical protein FF80_01626 [Devosia sp. LC5]|uniref:DUF2628 domain-containing protein n=1 Tax=Devosia sp. LC5 TaxID=1502724 RepID=UPI0004E346F3|nr:DUF2628 domain-containing protein [Devosia sp. LC5]KFC68673.1 hypothetical protein FF80_01626 [Devosia sp. LC5]